LNVNPGKLVEEGDVLAKLDRISALQEAVENAG
jgi:multidrug efflux pump subunit AcrA (membrane-fusion protein)